MGILIVIGVLKFFAMGVYFDGLSLFLYNKVGIACFTGTLTKF